MILIINLTHLIHKTAQILINKIKMETKKIFSKVRENLTKIKLIRIKNREAFYLSKDLRNFLRAKQKIYECCKFNK